jgi:23S rRNA A2030 N6-methylase RlmJ
MANTYAANFGDVVKHAVLCEVLVRERPRRYLESHGGRLDYALGDIDPGPGGVWDFLELGSGVGLLDGSEYGRLIAGAAGTPENPGTYPGSIALADAALPAGAEIVAFELVEASAGSLRDGLAARGRPAEVIVGDGLAGVCEIAEKGDLVLLDPFDVHARGETLSAAEAFAALASRGLAVVLWYAIYEPTETDGWISEVTSGIENWAVRIVGDTSLGGLAGCGFLGANLSPGSEATATAIVGAVAGALVSVRPGLRVERR